MTKEKYEELLTLLKALTTELEMLSPEAIKDIGHVQILANDISVSTIVHSKDQVKVAIARPPTPPSPALKEELKIQLMKPRSVPPSGDRTLEYDFDASRLSSYYKK